MLQKSFYEYYNNTYNNKIQNLLYKRNEAGKCTYYFTL